MEGGNSVELTTSHGGSKKKADKPFKSANILKKVAKGIPYDALRLFEGRGK